jgi:MtN3 and saliva related transmembrane protein
MALEDIFGWMAAIFTTLIFVPQIIQAFSTQMTRDISMLMLVFAVFGNASWFAQSILISNTPLTVCASLIIIMSVVLIVFKHINEKAQQ